MNGPATTRDSVLGGRLVLRQPAEGYRFAIDPVFLAAAVPARPGEQVLDLGAGIGTAALCLATRVPGSAVAGIELRPELVELAAANAVDNGLGERARFVAGDIRAARPPFPRASFDHVMANPPYGRPDRANPAGHPAKAPANVETDAALAEWVEFAAAMVRVRGTATFVYASERLDELLAAMTGRLGGVIVFPLWPGPDDRPAKRVLVQGVRGGAGAATLARGLVLHEADGAYTAAAESVLRDGQALHLSPRAA